MTLLSRALSFFPVLHALLTSCCLIGAIAGFASGEFASGLVCGLASLATLYLLPPFLYKVHEQHFPIREGFSRIDSSGPEPVYNSWWGGHQLQALYIACPGIESLLRVIPGAYSAWLRLWGAEIGRDVYWTPRVEVIDRPLISVGDSVVFGHRSSLCSHVIMRKRDGLRLYVKRIEIGSHCLVGADSNLGPGVKVCSGTELPYATKGWINQIFEKEAVHE